MPVDRQERSGVAVLTFASGKVNALDLELLTELGEAIDALAARRQPPPVVLTGAGRSFSAGVDLFRVLDEGGGYLDDFLPRIGGLLRRLIGYPGPVVAALNGHAIAGGYVVACGCDRRIMAAGAGKLGITELPVGVPFPWMALEAVRRVAGERLGREMVLLGSLYTPERGLELGLVDELTAPEELAARAVECAAALGRIPAEAFRLTKGQLAASLFRAAEAEERAHDERVLAVWKSPASRAAMRAFLERTVGRGGRG
ncbi:MAG: enoyl-CoA hydratase/isomerase family protein [Thermoanaerobaculia bacterium]|nr:enoyl-CoA hydratase/isomerase family protein [Thermoanaerobaculia bacterium]